MGTTLTALRFSGSQVGLVHVGDSRAYLLRGDQLAQITRDDTYVQFLVDSGKITADEAKDHPRRSVILRALTGADVEPDVSIREALAGDRYLLCSDGLSDVVSADTILDTMHIEDVQECADRLVELALRGGGPDNVTVIVAEVVRVRAGDEVDDVPVVAGALVDAAESEDRGSDSPAERAANIARPKLPKRHKDEDTSRPRRRLTRDLLLVAAILVLVIGALIGTYAWTQTQYFVGRDGAHVAIFRGVDAQFGPLKFYEVYEPTDISMSELDQAHRTQVSSGITAHSKADAHSIVDDLRTSGLLPLCPTATPTPPPPSHVPTPSAHASPTRPATGATTSSPAPPTSTPTPGVDCR